MADAPGTFRFETVDGPAETTLCNWVLVNSEGDIVAMSYASVSRQTAEREARWIIDNAKDFVIPPAIVRRPGTR